MSKAVIPDEIQGFASPKETGRDLTVGIGGVQGSIAVAGVRGAL
jgi:hypothetical protein